MQPLTVNGFLILPTNAIVVCNLKPGNKEGVSFPREILAVKKS